MADEKMNILDQDLLSVRYGIIVHQVNCMGAMGAGLALKIRNKWPIVYEKYMNAFESGLWKLGRIQVVRVSENLYVVNLAGQYRYGRDKRYTDYGAVRKCLQKISQIQETTKLPVYLPFKMGCNLGGGDWNTVIDIIEHELPTAIICKH